MIWSDDHAEIGILHAQEPLMATRYSRAGAYVPDRQTEMMLDYSTRLMKERFEAQPAERKAETRARVTALLRERRQHSALWKLARAVYGIDPELLDV